MNKKLFATLFIGAGMILMSPRVFSNDIREISLAEKINESTVVAIGRVVQLNSGKCKRAQRCAVVQVTKLLKGKKTDKFLIITKRDVSEENPNCCIIGRTYLFFLEDAISGGYVSVNGPHGVIEITP